MLDFHITFSHIIIIYFTHCNVKVFFFLPSLPDDSSVAPLVLPDSVLLAPVTYYYYNEYIVLNLYNIILIRSV